MNYFSGQSLDVYNPRQEHLLWIVCLSVSSDIMSKNLLPITCYSNGEPHTISEAARVTTKLGSLKNS